MSATERVQEFQKKKKNVTRRNRFLDRLIPARRLALSQSGKNVKRENVIVKYEGDSSRAPGPLGIFTALFTCSPHIENADLPEVGARLKGSEDCLPVVGHHLQSAPVHYVHLLSYLTCEYVPRLFSKYTLHPEGFFRKSYERNIFHLFTI